MMDIRICEILDPRVATDMIPFPYWFMTSLVWVECAQVWQVDIYLNRHKWMALLYEDWTIGEHSAATIRQDHWPMQNLMRALAEQVARRIADIDSSDIRNRRWIEITDVNLLFGWSDWNSHIIRNDIRCSSIACEPPSIQTHAHLDELTTLHI